MDERLLTIPERYTSSLTTGEILLRPFQDRDIDELHEAVTESLETMSTWLQWCHAGYTREEAAAWLKDRQQAWQSGRTFDFAVTIGDDLVGACMLSRIFQSNFANLEYWVRRTSRGQGIASRAVQLVARFGCDTVGFERAVIFAPAANNASRRVAEKAGAHNDGILPGRLVIHGQLHDAALYSFMPTAAG